MYNSYFGLEKTPFKITSDPSLFFTGGARGAMLEALLFAVNRGEGITKVVGEVGSGKTMLCRMMAYHLEKSADIVYLANPSIGPKNILQVIAKELNLNVEFYTDKVVVLQQLTEYLVKRHTQNRRVVLLVEEAQSMPIKTLEEIRLLSNLETDEEKLLQIILFGQPELDKNLDNPAIRQVRERITTNIYLNEFEAEDVHEYLNHRMYQAGYRGPDVFSESAAQAMLKPSKGLVRRINILADKALMVAYSNKRKKVKVDDIYRASGDSDFYREWLTPQQITYVVFAISLVLAFSVGMWLTKFYIHSKDSSVQQVNALIESQPPQGIVIEESKSTAMVKENEKH